MTASHGISPADLEHCRAAIRTGSLSFHSASKMLPGRVRDPALALYAFCRLADDEVDEGDAKERAVLKLQERLDLAYRGMPRNAPEDRAFAAIIDRFEMPRDLPEALLEGLAWDSLERRYQTLSDVRSYSARVASAVGAMMCVLMEMRDPNALARACDLGVAMQLTNIARDVGEDARAGRLYLPLDWFEDAGVDPDAFLDAPEPTREIKRMVSRLLAEAERLYLRSEAGIRALPRDARMGIWAARLIYAGIGREVRRNGFDSVTRRAHTTMRQKLGWMAQASGRAAIGMVMPRSAVIYAPCLDETAYLVSAAGRTDRVPGRAQAIVDLLAEIRLRDARMQEQVGKGFSGV